MAARTAADGKWVAENCADGCGRRGCKGVAGNGWGEEAAGDERPWLRGRLRTANGLRRTARMAADGVGATEWLEMGGEKGKEGKGWERKGQEGKGRDRRGKGRERMGKEGKGKGKEGKGRERKGKEGKGCERMGKEGKGWERLGKERKRMGKEGKGMERTAADGVGAREWLEMGGEKKPLVMSELGCADGCGREMGAENWGMAADGCGATCNGRLEMGARRRSRW